MLRRAFVCPNKSKTYGIVACANHTTVAGYCHTGNADIILGDELVGTLVLSQVPDPYITTPVAANQLSLVRVDDHVVDRHAMGVVALNIARSRIPDLNGAVLG